MARAAHDAGIAGLAFFSGIPGTIGGALRMNAGAYGGETKDVLVEARGVDRAGQHAHLRMPTWAFPIATAACPTTSSSPQALFQGRAGEPEAIAAEMAEIKTSASRASRATAPAARPSRTRRAERLEAGRRGRLPRPAPSAARRSPTLHCNFLINPGGATAADIEGWAKRCARG